MWTFIQVVDGFTQRVSQAVAWITVPVILALFVAVPLRYIFHYATTYLDDWPQMGHSALFVVGAAYALLTNDHVRVDIFYKRMTVRHRAAVDLVGTFLFLIPWLTVIGYYGWPFVRESWRVLEAFGENFTPGYFLSKSLILVFVGLAGLQALANAMRAMLALLKPAETGAGSAGGRQ